MVPVWSILPGDEFAVMVGHRGLIEFSSPLMITEQRLTDRDRGAQIRPGERIRNLEREIALNYPDAAL